MNYLLVAGSRDFNDSGVFEEVIQEVIAGKEAETVIVEGTAKGADTLAKEYAVKHCMQCMEFRPDWKKYGRAAGPKRNDAMTDFVSGQNGAALYFWDGQSKGTKQCIESARKRGIRVTIWDTKSNRFMERAEAS